LYVETSEDEFVAASC